MSDFEQIVDSFVNNYSIFYKICSNSYVKESNETTRVSIGWSKIRNTPAILVNPEFWGSATLASKRAALAHEVLHILLDHTRRTAMMLRGIKTKEDMEKHKKLAHIAADMVTNELLQRVYRMKRTDIDPNNDQAWADVIFPAFKIHAPPRANMEVYYLLLKNMSEEQQQQVIAQVNCSEGPSQDSDSDNDLKNHAAEQANSEDTKPLESSEDGKKSMQSDDSSDDRGNERGTGKKAGIGKSGVLTQVKLRSLPRKQKWESVIKRWVRKQYQLIDIEQWARKDRRWESLDMAKMDLPSDLLSEEEKKHKIDVVLFCDVSGSCVHLAERFIRAAQSIPAERFDVRAFTFDTEVYEANLKTGKMFLNGGGTSFGCLEDKIQEYRRENLLKRYPSAVFVITDGYGTRVDPQHPERWHWLLSEQCETYIPKLSQRYMLSEFE